MNTVEESNTNNIDEPRAESPIDWSSIMPLPIETADVHTVPSISNSEEIEDNVIQKVVAPSKPSNKKALKPKVTRSKSSTEIPAIDNESKKNSVPELAPVSVQPAVVPTPAITSQTNVVPTIPVSSAAVYMQNSLPPVMPNAPNFVYGYNPPIGMVPPNALLHQVRL